MTSGERCGEFTADVGFDGSRQRCRFGARWTVERDGERRQVCTKHRRKLRALGWALVREQG